jgi:hypothetical protein
MDNNTLAEKIVKVIENETTHIDMMEGVVGLLEKYRPKIKNIKENEKELTN